MFTLKKLISNIISVYYLSILRLLLIRRCAKISNNITLWGLPLITIKAQGKLEIGSGTIITSWPSRNSLGVFQKTRIYVFENARLDIDSNVGMSGVSITARESIYIGENTLLGSGVLITDNDAHNLDCRMRSQIGKDVPESSPVCIERDVFIGARAIVLKGVKVGEGSVIGAGSVVTQDVPPFTIVAGNPARVVKELKSAN